MQTNFSPLARLRGSNAVVNRRLHASLGVTVSTLRGCFQEQANTLRDSVPFRGGEWTVPEFGIAAVRGELEDHVIVLRHIADDARSGGDAAAGMRIDKQAKRIERLI